MPFDRFLIAPSNTGLQTNLKPWLIADDAFQQLNNAYVFRGRVRKRFGSQYTGTGFPSALLEPYFSRLAYNLGNTDGSGNLSGTVPGGAGTWKIGQSFSIGTQVFTATQATGALLASPGSGSGTYNTTNGNFTFTGATAATPVFVYLSQPVMGLGNIESVVVNDQPSIAFDTRFAYRYNGRWINFTGAGPWHGADTNFFWTTNWQGQNPQDDTLYVSNFYVVNKNGLIDANDDPIWYYNVKTNTWTAASGANAFYFKPADGAIHTGPYVVTARIIIPFKNRLVLLNTIESDGTNNTWYPFRARFSAYDSTVAVNSWYEPNQTDSAGNVSIGGGFNDAPTEEEIITAEFIKDRLIVYFENSTWELVWTGNQIYPFQWQKINTELGSDATFSVVPFDREVLAIGTVGVHACNGANTQRIDEKIPDEIFELNKEESLICRVVGVRDYFAEMVYWTFPNGNATQFPNKVLVYNYRNQSWAFNDDSITFFGYFEQGTSTTWQDVPNVTWEQANFTWNSGIIEANFRQVIAGNQQGFVYIINPDISYNEGVMQITNIVQSTPSTIITITIIDHNLVNNEYIWLSMPGVSIADDQTPPNTFTIFQVTVIDSNTITIGSFNFPLILVGSYTGGGVAGRVSRIDILSKAWNPYINNDRNVYIQRIDFCVTKTTSGAVTVDYFPSGTTLSMLAAGGDGTIGTQSNMGNGVLETSPYALYPLEQEQQRLWHPVYFQTDGQTIQIRVYLSDDQMIEPDTAYSDMQIEGMILYTQPTTARLQ